MIGKTILHYKILAKLGEGGMGVVYKAEDTKLERIVAIKFLPHHIAANAEERERFKIEAKAAAALNHPNIATIYAIEEVDGEMFIVMEFIDGQELRKLLIDNGQLSIDNCVAYAAQIAEGLKAAHAKGVTHRDIKSSNIMVTTQGQAESGQVKIMDFGLAKIAGGAQLTKDHSTLGTAAYMSPEQARGEIVDHRTDIWAFGVVLYEMLTGQLPFRGEYEQAVIYSICHEEPEQISRLRPEVPEFLNQLVTATLAKSRGERPQEMQEVLQALRKNAANANTIEASPSGLRHDTRTNKPTRAVLFSILAIVLLIAIAIVYWSRIGGKKNLSKPSPPRIVVLPLENLGPVEQEYFADGLTGEITSQLSGLSGLLVIARSSAMQYKETTKNLQQIAEELRVDYVLEGTMQWEETENGGKRIRVNPALIKTADATQVWSQPYEADFSSAFKLQADIAATVAQALNITLLAGEQKSLQGKLTNNPEAYDIYLQAKQYSFDTQDEKRARIAAQLFSQAVALDTSFAAAYAALSQVQAEMYWFKFERTEEILQQSLANAQRALALDPNLPDGHVALGGYYYHGRLAYLPALQAYNEALRLQPNNVDAYLGIGSVRRRQGQMREAMMSYKKAYDLDPRNFRAVEGIGPTYILLREYKQAEPFLERARSYWPDIPTGYENQARIYLLRDGDPTKARAVARAAHENGMESPSLTFTLFTCNLIENNLTMAVSQLEDSKEIEDQYMFKPHDLLTAQVHGLRGEGALAREKYDSARRLIEDEIKKHPEDSRLYSSLGIAYAGLGQKAEAIREGKRAVDLLPLSREAWRGSYRLLDLAQIYTMVGELDLALDAMDELLELPTDAISVALFKLDPTWAPLREHPRYKALLTKYSRETP